MYLHERRTRWTSDVNSLTVFFLTLAAFENSWRSAALFKIWHFCKDKVDFCVVFRMNVISCVWILIKALQVSACYCKMFRNSHYSIRSICSRLGHDICQQMLVMLTTCGCDMVSAWCVANQQFSSASLHKDPVVVLLILYSPWNLKEASQDSVVKAGMQLMIRIYSVL